MGNNCLIILFFKKSFKTDFNLCLNGHMLLKLFRISSFQKNFILIIIFINQCIYIRSGNSIHTFCNLIDWIGINFPAEFDLRFYFISLCNRYITHIISYTHDTNMAAFDNTYRCTHPGCYLTDNDRIRKMSNNHFTFNPHSADNMAVFPVTMC